MNRRDVLGAAGGALVTSLAGCLGVFETESAWRDPPLVEDRPDAVYVPASIEEMGTYATTTAGEYGVALMYTFPHRFWTVADRETNLVDVESDDSLHLMASVWDAETDLVVPTNVTLSIEQDGERVADPFLWPMLSQRMGFHYGNNVVVSDEGTYTATIGVEPVSARPTGAFEGRFGDPATADIEFEYTTDDVYDLDFEQIEESRQGERDAVPLMDHGGHQQPLSVAPAVDSLPGTLVGTERSGDARFAVTASDEPRFGDGVYLAVSPRTPHNRILLPGLALSATVERDGETVFDDVLTETLDPEFGHHYGAAVGTVEAGDRLTIAVDAPPQVSRHDGYETAFLDMPGMEIDVPEV